jgi:glycerophosphoryl diester phosphodiesterase
MHEAATARGLGTIMARKKSPFKLLTAACLIAPLFLMNTELRAEVTLPDPLVIAHRGASAIAPENTAAAIREAIRLGAKVIEFDVRVTSDGELVLFHDKELDRVVGRPGTIEASAWEAVQTFDVGTWFTGGKFAGEKVLRFDDAIRLCLEGGATPLIEHKTGSAKAYAAVIEKLGVGDRVIVQSFDWDFLTEFKEVMPGVLIGALGSKELTSNHLSDLKTLSPDWVGWNFNDLKDSDIPRLRVLGATVVLWTVNNPDIAISRVSAGVDGIITDVPDVITGALKR